MNNLSATLNFIVLQCLLCWTQAIDLSSIPDQTNVMCLPHDQHVNIADYNKVEIVNNFQKYALKDLLSQRGFVPENEVIYQQFLDCVWRMDNFITSNDQFNYDKLELEIKKAIINVVGSTGPAIHLSKAHARNIVNECRIMTGVNNGQKIIKMQNYIVRKLLSFSKI